MGRKTAIIILTIFLFISTVSASELSDYTYLVNHQDNPRNVVMLKDMAYHFGGMDRLEAKMNAMTNVPVVRINAYAKYNPENGNVEWTNE